MGGSMKGLKIGVKRVVSLTLIAVLTWSGVCANGNYSYGREKAPKVAGGSRKSSAMSLHVEKTRYVVGKGKKLQTIRVKNVSAGYSVDWKSNNKKLVKVRAGRKGKATLTVTPKRQGKAKVTATVKNKKTNERVKTFAKVIKAVEGKKNNANPTRPPRVVPTNEPTSPPSIAPTDKPLPTDEPRNYPEATYDNSLFVTVERRAGVQDYSPDDFPEADVLEVFVIEKTESSVRLLLLMQSSDREALDSAKEALRGNELVKSVSNKGGNVSTVTLDQSEMTLQVGEEATLEVASSVLYGPSPFINFVLVKFADGWNEEGKDYTVEDFPEYEYFERVWKAGFTRVGYGYWHIDMGGRESFVEICARIDRVARDERFDVVYNGEKAIFLAPPPLPTSEWTVADPSVVEIVEEWETLSDGEESGIVLKALKEGTTTVTLEYAGNRYQPPPTATCTVTVVGADES